MKKLKKLVPIFVFLIALVVCGCVMKSKDGNVNAAKTTKSGLVRENGYTYFYGKDGKKVTGWKEVNGVTYYFRRIGKSAPKGAAMTGWMNQDGKRYYFNAKGALQMGFRNINGKKYYFKRYGKLGEKGSAITGFKTLGGHKYYFYRDNKAGRKYRAVVGWMISSTGKYYYFDANGYMQKGWLKVGKFTYYLCDKGYAVTGTRKIDGKVYMFNKRGQLVKTLTGDEYDNYLTLQDAKKIVAQITNSGMTKEQKLRACFDWVVSKPYVMYRKFDVKSNWINDYANDHFKRDGGDCHSDAAAFAFLAKALGYDEVYVCLDCDGVTAMGHSWTEINGKVYDPLFAEAKGKTPEEFAKYYNASYGAYPLTAILHIKLCDGM